MLKCKSLLAFAPTRSSPVRLKKPVLQKPARSKGHLLQTFGFA